MNAALWYHAIGAPNDTLSDAAAIAMTRRWIQLDWVRVAGGLAAFVAALVALTSPWPGETATRDPWFVRVLLVIAVAGIAGFLWYFVSNI